MPNRQETELSNSALKMRTFHALISTCDRAVNVLSIANFVNRTSVSSDSLFLLLTMKQVKRCYDTSRPIPHILRQVLDNSGWEGINRKKLFEQEEMLEKSQLEQGSQVLVWRGSRPSRKELNRKNQVGREFDEYFNHFPETYVITSKVRLAR